MVVGRSPITLYPSKKRTIFFLIFSLVFSITGLWILSTGGSIVGVFTILFSGLGFVVSVVNLIPSASYLRISETGFEMRSLFRSSHTSWSEVDRFMSEDNKSVVFKYRQDHYNNIVGQNFTRKVFGIDGALPDLYGMSAGELVALLNEWKDRFLLAKVV